MAFGLVWLTCLFQGPRYTRQAVSSDYLDRSQLAEVQLQLEQMSLPRCWLPSQIPETMMLDVRSQKYDLPRRRAQWFYHFLETDSAQVYSSVCYANEFWLSLGPCMLLSYPPTHPHRVWKIPASPEKHQNIDVEKNGNQGCFHSSVTLTKGFGCFGDTFGGVRGPLDTELGGEMPYFGNNGQ